MLSGFDLNSMGCRSLKPMVWAGSLAPIGISQETFDRTEAQKKLNRATENARPQITILTTRS